MQNLSEKTESAPPSYTSCVTPNGPSVPPELDQFNQIVNGHETLHFYSPSPMSLSTVPEVIQIRDSAQNPILSVMYVRQIVSSGRNHVAASRQIMTPSGEALIAASGGNV